jgi:uncharacterized protein YciI
MTDEESAVFAEHFDHLQRLLADGVLVLAGPTLGEMESDPAVSRDVVTGELRELRVSLLRGRD